MAKKVGFWVLLCLLTFLSGSSQEYVVEHFTTQNGLASNECYSVVQGKAGYIWTSTDRGISRFDGSSFKTYDFEQGLLSTVVYSLIALPQGGIAFFGGGNKVGLLRNDSTKYLATSTKDQIHDIYNFHNGVVVCYRNRSFYQYFSSEGELIREKEFPYSFCLVELDSNQCFAMGSAIRPSADSKYISVNGLIFPLTISQHFHHGNIRSLPYYEKQLLINSRYVHEIENGSVSQSIELNGVTTAGGMVTSNNELMIGSFRNGIQILDANKLKFKNQILEGVSISEIIEDQEGQIWATSLESGLYKIQRSLFTNLSNKDISNLIQFGDSLCYSTSDSFLYSYNVLEQKELKIARDLKTHSMYVHNNRLTVVGTGPWNRNSNLANIEIRDGTFASTYWKGRQIGVLHRWVYDYNLETNQRKISDVLPSGYTYFLKNINDRLFFGRPSGLYELIEIDTAFSYRKILEIPSTCILPFQKGFLIGSKGHGIKICDHSFGLISTISKRNGLSGNYVSDILLEKDTLWIGTEKGVDKVLILPDFNLKILGSVNSSKGLNSNTTRKIVRSNGSLFIATDKGLQRIKVNDFQITLRNPIPKITHINDLKLHESKRINVEAGTKIITIKVAKIFYHKDQTSSMEFRLLGLDTSWTLTNSKELEFTNLKPGEYTIELRSKLPENNNYSFISQSFSLPPTFWQSWLFKFLMTGLIIILFISILKLREKRIKKIGNLLVEQEKLKFRALTAQLNPHFMFNALGSIQNLIIIGKNTVAAEYLSRFSDLISATLSNSSKLFIPLHEELLFIDQYIEIEKSRFEKNIRFEWQVDPDVNIYSIEVPPMFLQPYIENSIQHGVRHIKGEGYIQVGIQKVKNSSLRVIIQDNGIGLKESKKLKKNRKRPSLAMENLSSRLEVMSKLYKNRFTYQAEELKDINNKTTGTKITITVPIKKT